MKNQKQNLTLKNFFAVVVSIVFSFTMLSCKSVMAFRGLATHARRSRTTPSFFSKSVIRPVAVVASSTFLLKYSSRNEKMMCLRHTSSRIFSTSTEIDSSSSTGSKPIPIALIAGFLGSGKTTCLQNILTNRDGIKVGVIVNDVAAVNIDSKLLSNPNNLITGDETVELQNGCACCSLADELLDSVIKVTDNGKRDLDCIVVELSGVADPQQIQSNWEEATMTDHPATKLAQVERVITLVDSCTFGTDWMTWDSSGDRENWVEEGDDCSAQRMVPELLAEQVEAADVLVINKIDLAGEEQVQTASNVAQSLNKDASMYKVKFGEVSAADILNFDDAKNSVTKIEQVVSDEQSHGDHESQSCKEPDCTDSSHSHSHAHDHEQPCADPACTDSSHSHSHAHDDEPCADADCTDTSHEHSHEHASNTSADKLGITNFVYTAKRPFDSNRLMELLNQWPVPIKEELDLIQLNKAVREGYDISEVQVNNVDEKNVKNPFIGVLRSKGFCWLAPSKWNGSENDTWRHDTAMYWSHAGKHFGISTAGKWWGSVSKEQMKGHFTSNMKEYERILSEDFVSEEWGDRRQELVFIGASISESDIRTRLDECLISDKEMDMYKVQLQNFFDTTITQEATGTGGPSLFDVGGTDHMDSDMK